MNAADISRKEKYSRCIALEEDYVHRVYESIGKELAQAKDPMKDTVRQFLDELEPGSLVADIACGDGKHLRDKAGVFSVGAERSTLQASLARQRCQEVLLGDNLRLPFRSNAFDAALSIEVLHHFTTKKRRIEALKEISRVLKVGGRALITVQRHNNKISQDVLIPWFDVPKEKKVKDEQRFGDDSLEYECNIRDDEEDEDSISLPSSDEEDSPWMNNAKYFPPKRYTADSGWNSQSLIYESTTASNHVPNKLQTVQNNTCYAFVQRAFERFSTDNATSEDQYCMSQFGVRDNSPVPLNSVSENDQKLSLSNCSSFNLDENLLRTISDNFIELLNIDSDEDTSKLNTLEECMSGILSKENSKLVQNRNSLMRSFSDIFKNMNSLWSSKSTKSCSDLKSLGVTNIYANGNECTRNRLVRSRTTTCTPEFNRMKSVKDSKESDMTMSEAVKIINDFLDSTTPTIETVRGEESGQDNSLFTHSDIVNGNTLPLKCSIDKKDKFNANDKLKDHKSNLIKKMPLLKEEEFNHADLTYDLCQEKNSTIGETENCDFAKSMQMSNADGSLPDLFPISGSNSKSVIYYSKKNCSNEKINCLNTDEEIIRFDRGLLEAQLRKQYSFLYDDEFDEDEEEIIKASDLDEYERKGALCNRINLIEDNDLQPSYFDDELFYFFENVSSETFENKPSKANYVDKSFEEFNMNNISALYGKDNFVANGTAANTFSKRSITPSLQYSHLKMEDDEVCEFDCCVGAGCSSSKCFLQSSPKKRRKTNHNENPQRSDLNTLGPFYDEDNDYTYTDVDFPLASYYSMPELHALSEFYEEYILYQNYLLETLTPELLNYQYSYLKSSNIQPRKENLEIKSKVQNKDEHFSDYKNDYLRTHNKVETLKILDIASSKNNTENENKLQTCEKFDDSLKLVKKDLEECSISEPSIEDMKRELCNNIQTEFTLKNSSLNEIKLDNVGTIPEITFDNEKNDVAFTFQLKSDSFTDLDNKLASKICLNNKRSTIECYNNSIFFQSLGVSRSCSSLHENANFNKLVEIPSLSSISASQPSLKFSPKRDLKLNLNKYRLNQINLYHSLSSDILGDEDIFSNFLKRTSVERLYCKKNTCALKELKRDTDESVRLVSNILEKCPHQVSYVSSSNSNEMSEFSPNFNKPAHNEEVRSHSQLLINSNIYIENVLNNEKLTTCGNCKYSDSIKLTDSYCENSTFSTHLKNNKEHSESFNSKEKAQFLEHCVCSVREHKNFEQKLYLNECSDEILTESAKSEENSKDSGSSLQNSTKTFVTHDLFPHTYSYKNPLNFSSENISKTEHQSSQLQVADAIQGKSVTECSTQRNNEVPTDGKFTCNFSSIAVDQLDQTSVKAEDSNFTEHIHGSNIGSEKTTDSEHSLDKTGIEDERTNYTYGRIHEDGAAVVSHRYHHLFQEEELYDLIENNISDLHVLESFVEELHLCIIAEKQELLILVRKNKETIHRHYVGHIEKQCDDRWLVRFARHVEEKKFKWPEREDVSIIDEGQIKKNINHPILLAKMIELLVFCFNHFRGGAMFMKPLNFNSQTPHAPAFW